MEKIGNLYEKKKQGETSEKHLTKIEESRKSTDSAEFLLSFFIYFMYFFVLFLSALRKSPSWLPSSLNFLSSPLHP